MKILNELKMRFSRARLENHIVALHGEARGHSALGAGRGAPVYQRLSQRAQAQIDSFLARYPSVDAQELEDSMPILLELKKLAAPRAWRKWASFLFADFILVVGAAPFLHRMVHLP